MVRCRGVLNSLNGKLLVFEPKESAYYWRSYGRKSKRGMNEVCGRDGLRQYWSITFLLPILLSSRSFRLNLNVELPLILFPSARSSSGITKQLQGHTVNSPTYLWYAIKYAVPGKSIGVYACQNKRFDTRKWWQHSCWCIVLLCIFTFKSPPHQHSRNSQIIIIWIQPVFARCLQSSLKQFHSIVGKVAILVEWCGWSPFHQHLCNSQIIVIWGQV